MADVRGECEVRPEARQRRHRISVAPWRIGRPFPIGPKVEDPVRIAQLVNHLQDLCWKADHQEQALVALYASVADLTLAEVRYYYARRVAARWLARLLRLIAWLFGTAGLMVPITMPLWEAEEPSKFLSWGFLAGAVAGSMIVADTIFAGSGAHRRYVKTQLSIERLFELFVLDWQLLMVDFHASDGAARAKPLIARAIEYCRSLHDILGIETRDWMSALERANANLASLHQKASRES